MQIKNIIFDLGGILIDLDFDKTIQGFARLGFKEMDQLFGLGKAASFVEDYEVGKIDDEQFISSIRATTKLQASDEAIIDAWNALLLDFPKERIELVRELSTTHRLFLFSNTNSYHQKFFAKKFLDQFSYDLNELFEKAYYSHEIQQRKPYQYAFQWILRDAGLIASETLFIDDALNNIEGAQEVGIQTEYVPKGKTIMDIFWKQYGAV